MDAATRMNGETLLFDASAKAVRISDGNGSRLDFPCLPAEEFPQDIESGNGASADFAAGELTAALRTVLPFVCDNASYFPDGWIRRILTKLHANRAALITSESRGRDAVDERHRTNHNGAQIPLLYPVPPGDLRLGV
jgi:hypothetical protein